MGKRNKTKQKKAKTTSKHNAKQKKESSMFGIAVSKGKHGKGQRLAFENNFSSQTTTPSSNKVTNDKDNANGANTGNNNNSDPGNKATSSKMKMKSWNKPSMKTLKKNILMEQQLKQQLKKDGMKENLDYAKELASLQERQYHEEMRKKAQRQRQKQGNVNPNNINNNQNNTGTSMNFTPGTLSHHFQPKSTETLIQETTQEVATNLGVTEQQQQHMQWGSNQLQLLAAQKRQQWEQQGTSSQNFIMNHAKEEENDWEVEKTKNPFAALGDDDSDDDNKNSSKQGSDPPPMMFSFAPASFQIQSSSNGGDHDFDDL